MNQHYLKSILEYNTETGIFRWVSPANQRIRFYSVAGTLDKKGYIRIKIDGKYYAAHRLAWLYMTGKFPESQIDHKNEIKDDNRWENLREADNGQNQNNTGHYANNKLGVKGVYNYKGRFRAQIQVNNKTIF